MHLKTLLLLLGISKNSTNCSRHCERSEAISTRRIDSIDRHAALAMTKQVFKATLFLSLILFSCNYKNQNTKSETASDTLKNEYAKGFRIIKHTNYTSVEVVNPWQQAKNISITYVLGAQKPQNLNANECFIKTPIRKVVCMSTTHIAYLDALGKLESVKAISGASLVCNQNIRKKISESRVLDIGYEQSINYELLVSQKPDVVFAYSVGAEVSGLISKLKSLNIPVVVVGEYLENEALAKTEWIKFFASFYNEEQKANAIFDSIRNQYTELKVMAQLANNKPIVMSSLPWNGTWYISGGQTYMGQLIKHANASYLWSHVRSRESVPMDYELVFQQSIKADIWLNLSSCNTLNDVLSIDARLKSFKAFKNNMLYNNNARVNTSGGNDYWESGTMQPQVVLKDLIAIFHPELLPNYQLVYYKKLK